MSKIRKRIENRFEKLAHVLYCNPIKVLIIAFIFIGVLGYQANKITVNTSSEAMLYPDDPIIIQYKAFQDQFGRDEDILIAVQTTEVFNIDFLNKLKSFHHDLENKVPHIQKIYSLINAQSIRTDGDALVVETLIPGRPTHSIDLPALKERALNSTLLKNNIISENSRLTVILLKTGGAETEAYGENELIADFSDVTDAPESENLKFLSEIQRRELVDALHRMVRHHQSDNFTITLTGYPVLLDTFNRIVIKDVILLSIMGGTLVICFLWLLFRRLSGIVVPGIIIYSSLLSTLGFMSLFDIPMTLTTSTMPTFILAVGVADAIHILSVFYRNFHEGTSKKDAIGFAMMHSGLPVLLTSLTTAAGLLSFSFTDLLVIAQLGICSAVGVFLAFVYTILLTPALIALIPVRQEQTSGEKKQTVFVDRILLSIGDFSTTHPLKVLAVCVMMFLISIPFICKLGFGYNLIDSLSNPEILKGYSLIDRELKGTAPLEIVVDTKKIDGIKEPEILNRIEQFSDSILDYKNTDLTVGKVISINNIIKELNQALHENDPAYYKIPQNQKTISEELFLLKTGGSEELTRLADSNFSKARITIQTTWADATTYEVFIDRVQQQLQELFEDKADISITGIIAFFTRALNAAIQSMLSGYLYAFAAITLFMILLVGDVKLGLVIMIPNVLPIIFILAIIGSLKIPLDIVTMLIGCIAIGLVVDDTMHFIYNFQRYYQQSQDTIDAVRRTMTSTGRAILITSIILSSCFFIEIFASTKSTVMFGIFTGITIILALLADFFLAPALMVLLKSKRKSPEKSIKKLHSGVDQMKDAAG